MTVSARTTAARPSGQAPIDAPPIAGGGGAAQIVTFRVGQDLFAADVRAVERVLRHQQPTPVPNVPGWVSGVFEYQNRVVPVIDLRVRFGAPPDAPTNETRVLVFTVGGAGASSWVAGVVDGVLDVTPIDRSQVSPAPALFRGLAVQYIQGIVRRDGRLVILLDADRFLSATERVALDRISGQTALVATADA